MNQKVTDTWCPPALRWAGSKRALISHLSARFRASESTHRRYIEPFAGSACLFFALRPAAAVIADLNTELIATYEMIRDHPRLLARAMHGWSTDRETYYSVRAISPADLDPLERAARFIYLNRLCFNGVYRTNRQGKFNVPYGTRTGALPDERHLYRCSLALRDAELRAGDFEATTADVGTGDFVYLDPPYTQDPRNAYGLYGYGSFEAGQVDRAISTLARIDDQGATFLFSYAEVDGLEDRLRPGWSMETVAVAGRIAANTTSRRLRREVLVTNAAAP